MKKEQREKRKMWNKKVKKKERFKGNVDITREG
jgi:hypothetical protein